ncbi:unnamed protein product [Calypogeia fissa]
MANNGMEGREAHRFKGGYSGFFYGEGWKISLRSGNVEIGEENKRARMQKDDGKCRGAEVFFLSGRGDEDGRGRGNLRVGRDVEESAEWLRSTGYGVGSVLGDGADGCGFGRDSGRGEMWWN